MQGEGKGRTDLVQDDDTAIAAFIECVVAQLLERKSAWLKFTREMGTTILRCYECPGKARVCYVRHLRYMPPGLYYLLFSHCKAVGFCEEADIRFVVEQCRERSGITLPYHYLYPADDDSM